MESSPTCLFLISVEVVVAVETPVEVIEVEAVVAVEVAVEVGVEDAVVVGTAVVVGIFGNITVTLDIDNSVLPRSSP